jgi:RNA polymerase sigma-70 factor (ECF subfamily)
MMRANPQPAAVPADDATVIARAIGGDVQALSTLYLRHARYVAGVVHRLIGRDGEVDDVVQETFITAAASLQNLRNPDQLRPWLATIAVRRAYRVLRKRALRDALSQTLSAFGARREVEVETSEDAQRVLDRLSPKLRVPWVLHRVFDATLPEVASMCEVSLATTKRRIAEAEGLVERWSHES